VFVSHAEQKLIVNKIMLFALIFLGQGNNVENINVEKGQILMSKGQIYGQRY